MNRGLWAILALCLMLVAGAGCGTSSVDTEPAEPAAESSDAADAMRAATIGDALAIAGNEAQLEVTLTKVKRLPAEKAYGMEIHPALYGVNLTVRNTGEAVYDDSITNCVALIDAKDQTLPPEFMVADKDGNTLTGQLDSVKIAPGDRRSGWVFFGVTKSQKPRTLQFTAESGFGPEVGEWTLD